MPTYGYFCESCGHKFEKLQKMSDKPFEVCPQCGKRVKRLIGAGAGVIFKGKGFNGVNYKNNNTEKKTCCGKAERCDKPPCSGDGVCKR